MAQATWVQTRPVEWCEQPDRPVVTHGYESYEGGAERGYRTPSIALTAWSPITLTAWSPITAPA